MQDKQNQKVGVEQTERTGLRVAEDLETIEKDSQSFSYHSVSLTSDGRRQGECPRGAQWDCKVCPNMYLEIQIDNTPPRILCTPYSMSDLRVMPYKKVEDREHFGVFIQDHMVYELGATSSVRPDQMFSINFHIMKAENKRDLN